MGSNINYKNITSEGVGGNRAVAVGGMGLTRQPSIYSLTFDELQSTMGSIGKDFGSMNMDELLKNIWSAEENQNYGFVGGGVVTTQQGNGIMNLQRQGSLTLPRTLSLKTVDQVWKDMSKEYGMKDSSNDMPQRQPTLGEITLEEFLAKAGVVREDTQLGGGGGGDGIAGSKVDSNGGFFGDLSRVGNNNITDLGFGFQQMASGANLMGNRVLESSKDPNSNQSSNFRFSVNGVTSNLQQAQQQQHLQQQQQQQHLQQQQQQQQQIYPKQPTMAYASQLPLLGGAQLGSPGIRGGIMGIADQGISSTSLVQTSALQGGGMGMVGFAAGAVGAANGSPASHMSPNGISISNGDTSSVSPVPYVFNGGMKGRKMGGAVEKVVERRQRRMIKNRESAARSRARKQAYTVELEQEVAKLKEENDELRKKQAEFMEMQKNQVQEMINMQRGSKKRCLRRTQSGPW
ncbi:bZIP_1 domain-containing protein [Cephalotus follicularis]|uniref:BZIP_1 domain-containing protein n=1 Tax=Cephalotus follicularis TaxID=3775 RepID=A0A1Q3DBK2_CEPFO|nr:bZIP_1 domain-containing protein [Cephalotus follicularis]